MTDLDRLLGAGLVPILRVTDPAVALAAGRAFAAAGLRAVEVTASVPGAAEVIRRLAEELDGSAVLLGAGTVLSVEEARAFAAVGARFLVSPVLDPDVVAEAAALGVPHVPSGFTATEIHRAELLGAPLVKLFPAGPLGPGYLRALLGPFPGLRLMPTGGIEPDAAVEFIRAGAVAVGMGGALSPRRVEEAEAAARAARELQDRLDAARAAR